MIKGPVFNAGLILQPRVRDTAFLSVLFQMGLLSRYVVKRLDGFEHADAVLIVQ